MGSIATRLSQLGFRQTENVNVWRKNVLSQEITVTLKEDGNMEYATGNALLTERLRYESPATVKWLDHDFKRDLNWLEACNRAERETLDTEWSNFKKWRLF